MATADVIVVGGGIIGCSVARALALEGVRVRLLERDAIGAHASSAAAGMLAPIAESQGSGPLFDIGVSALETLPRWVEELADVSGVDPGLSLEGLVRLYGGPASIPGEGEPEIAWEVLPESLRALEVEVWDAAAVRAHLPGLDPGIEGARFSPLEGSVDPARLTSACAGAAGCAGVELSVATPVLGLIREGERVIGVRTSEGDVRCGHVVWCTGAWAPWLLPEVPRVDVEPVKGQMLALRPPGGASGPILFSDPVYMVPRRDGTLRVGATVERVGFDTTPTLQGVRALSSAAIRIAPQLEKAGFEATWAGLRPGTPDGLPLIGAHPGLRGLVLAVGHYRNGILLSERTGRWVADALLRPESPEVERKLLAVDRFAVPRSREHSW